MTSSELQFAVIKDELTAMVDDIIRQFLNDKVYEKDQAQNWCNGRIQIRLHLHYLPKRICFNELQLNLLMEPQPRRICHCQI